MPAPAGRTIDDRAAELHTLLVNAQIPGPYVLVAHSYGGWIVRIFARDHRDQVAGMVLVDTGEESVYSRPDVVAFYSKLAVLTKALGWIARVGLFRLFRPSFLVPPGLPPALSRVAAASSLRPHSFFAAADEVASLKRSPWMSQPQALGTLGNLPLVVINHGKPFPGPFKIVEKYWEPGQRRLAALSTSSDFIVAENSNHMIHFDEPDFVVESIRRIVAVARNPTQTVAASDAPSR
jgi:pimeloyl-ACP methyl ester carboxylesterase